jgi:antitoxin (DNA-binding transcriptional repressor) of toxin-antitoxin stability system
VAKYLTAKEFRQRLPQVAEDLSQWGEIVVVRHSRPLFKVVPLAQGSSVDLLDRAAATEDRSQPDLTEIARIVHELRGLAAR